MNHSKEVWHFGNALDHLGIVLVIWGSMVPIDYFGFYCDSLLQYFYCVMVGKQSSEVASMSLTPSRPHLALLGAAYSP